MSLHADRYESRVPWLIRLAPELRTNRVSDAIPDHDDRVRRRALRVPGGDGGCPGEDDSERRNERDYEAKLLLNLAHFCCNARISEEYSLDIQ